VALASPRGPSAAALLGGCRQWARDLVSQRTSGSALPAPAHPGSLTLRWAIMRQHWSCRLYPTTHRCPTRPATNRPPGTARSAEKPGPSPPRAGLGQVWPSEIRRPLRPKISQSVAIRDQATSAPEDFSKCGHPRSGDDLCARRFLKRPERCDSHSRSGSGEQDEFWTWGGETCAAARTPPPVSWRRSRCWQQLTAAGSCPAVVSMRRNAEHPQWSGALDAEHRGVGPHEDLCPDDRGRVRAALAMPSPSTGPRPVRLTSYPEPTREAHR